MMRATVAPRSRWFPTDETLRGRRQLEGAVSPGPVIGSDGTVYAASNADVLHALNPSTGA
jgi:outer membrane protein assembly factor BamB